MVGVEYFICIPRLHRPYSKLQTACVWNLIFVRFSWFYFRRGSLLFFVVSYRQQIIYNARPYCVDVSIEILKAKPVRPFLLPKVTVHSLLVWRIANFSLITLCFIFMIVSIIVQDERSLARARSSPLKSARALLKGSSGASKRNSLHVIKNYTAPILFSCNIVEKMVWLMTSIDWCVWSSFWVPFYWCVLFERATTKAKSSSFSFKLITFAEF